MGQPLEAGATDPTPPRPIHYVTCRCRAECTTSDSAVALKFVEFHADHNTDAYD